MKTKMSGNGPRLTDSLGDVCTLDEFWVYLEVFSDRSPRCKRVAEFIAARYDRVGNITLSYREIGEVFGVSSSRSNHIIKWGLRRIMHPYMLPQWLFGVKRGY